MIRLSAKDQISFARDLSFLVRAGIPILASLRVLQEQARSPREQAWLEQVMGKVAGGRSLHASLAHSGRRLGQMTINLIKIGERSGTLSRNLEYLAAELKKERLLKRKIISALIYPVFISIATLVLVGGLMVFILPKITPVFRGMQLELPLITQIMMGVSNFLRQDGLWLLGTLVGGVITIYIARHYSRHFRNGLAWLNLRAPVLGRLTLNYQLAGFCRTLGLLLKSGTPLSEALKITADTVRHPLYRRHIQCIDKDILRGERVSNYLTTQPTYFPPLMTNLTAIGEKTGALADTLLHLNEFYEQEIDNLTKNLSSTIEPTLMIIMGFLVGLVAISIITPIYEITQNI
ncbi:MAG: type II secretion system F family protein [Patescibacteria group bacterium]|nr:type II secretion system F family protein [Patescibacteria group bacterium]